MKLQDDADPDEDCLIERATACAVKNKQRSRQFTCWIPVILPDGSKKMAHCLCDNGAEANLVSFRFIPEALRKPAKDPIALEGVS